MWIQGSPRKTEYFQKQLAVIPTHKKNEVIDLLMSMLAERLTFEAIRDAAEAINELLEKTEEAKLIKLKHEIEYPIQHWCAYFQGTPTEAQLEEAWRSQNDEMLYFAPHQVQDALADHAGLQRWVLNNF